MIKNLIYIIIICSTLLSQDTLSVMFKYGILLNPTSNPDTTISLVDSSVVYRGDRLRIVLNYSFDSFFYVVLKSNDGSYFAKDVDCIKEDNKCNDHLYIGDFDDSKGEEILYLINTKEKQTDLETYISDYNDGSEVSKIELGRKIGYEIFSLMENDKLIGRRDLRSQELDDPFIGGIAFRGEGNKLTNYSATHIFKGEKEVAIKKVILNHK